MGCIIFSFLYLASSDFSFRVCNFLVLVLCDLNALVLSNLTRLLVYLCEVYCSF